jgi:hypothetical protein
VQKRLRNAKPSNEIERELSGDQGSVTAVDKDIGEMAGVMSSPANSTELVRGNMQALAK